jgi:hypothetical protein
MVDACPVSGRRNVPPDTESGYTVAAIARSCDRRVDEFTYTQCLPGFRMVPARAWGGSLSPLPMLVLQLAATLPIYFWRKSEATHPVALLSLVTTGHQV